MPLSSALPFYRATGVMNEGPQLTLNVTLTASTLSGTAPLSVTLTGSATGGTGNYSFTWTFGDGTGGSGPDQLKSYSAAGSYIVTLTVSDGTLQATKTTTITVSAATAALNLSISATPTSGTTPLSVALSAQGTGGTGGPYTYTWNFGDNTVGSGASFTKTFTNAATYTVSCTVSDGPHGPYIKEY